MCLLNGVVSEDELKKAGIHDKYHLPGSKMCVYKCWASGKYKKLNLLKHASCPASVNDDGAFNDLSSSERFALRSIGRRF